MNKQAIIRSVGRWNYLKWLFMNKILKKEACIGVDLICENGIWIRSYIDNTGIYRRKLLK